jgi:hypothetical protein
MKPVVIESPYAGCVPLHKAYLQACIRDCLSRGETPYASHQMLTEALDDNVPEDRELSISSGLSMRDFIFLHGGYAVYYADLGWSSGMQRAKDADSNAFSQERVITSEDEWAHIFVDATVDSDFEDVFRMYDGGERPLNAVTARYLKEQYEKMQTTQAEEIATQVFVSTDPHIAHIRQPSDVVTFDCGRTGKMSMDPSGFISLQVTEMERCLMHPRNTVLDTVESWSWTGWNPPYVITKDSERQKVRAFAAFHNGK